LRDVPNARIQTEDRILQWLASADESETVGHLREALAEPPQGGIDPEELWNLGSQLPYDIDISWSADRADGCYDVVFRRRPAPGVEESTTIVFSFAASDRTKPLSACANNPLPERLTQRLIPYLRRILKEKLPDYMVPSAFVVLKTLPTTSNGKIDYQALPTPDMVGSQSTGAFMAPQTPAERILAGIWAEVLGLERVDIHDNFFALGGDSILSIQIIARAHQAGLRLTPKQLFQQQTIAELATVACITTPSIQAEQGLVTGPMPLTPIQHWLFEQDMPEPHHWNQAMLLEARQPLDFAVMEATVQHLLVHHDMLRARFKRAADGWRQDIVPPEASSLCVRVDLSALSAEQQEMGIAETGLQLQASLNLEHGPLLQVALFDRGCSKSVYLLVVIHRLVVDSVSWRLLLEDLQTIYQQLSAGQKLRLPPKTTSFKHWAERLHAYAQSVELRQDLTHWLAALRTHVARLPVDSCEVANSEALSRTVSVSLSTLETEALLQEASKTYKVQMDDILLTALVQSFARWTGEYSLLLDLQGCGREEGMEGTDLSRTSGWFTIIFPVLLQLEHAATPAEALKSVKEQLHCIPKRGIGYGMLRYLSQDAETAEKLRALPQAEVYFNYRGWVDQAVADSILFRSVRQTRGPSLNPRRGCRYLLAVDAYLTGSQLHCDWTYSQHIYQQITIEKLAQDFIEALRTLIVHCQPSETGGYAPSDFPQMRLSQRELDELITALGEAAERD
jgi:non-ribosomal peptide synthase protein (TIGR01720 family)